MIDAIDVMTHVMTDPEAVIILLGANQGAEPDQETEKLDLDLELATVRIEVCESVENLHLRKGPSHRLNRPLLVKAVERMPM